MDKPTIDAYNNKAKQYDDETVDFWNRFPRTFLDQFIKLSGKKIIDIGSGPGRDGQLLQQAGKDVTGVDASEAMVRLSTARGIPTVLADFNQLPFIDESYDGVWSYTTLLHCPKDKIATPLQEIWRILKPNGIFALGMIEGNSEEYKVSPKVSMPRWFSFYHQGELERTCTSYGFVPVHFETFKPGSKNYLQFIFQKQTT